MVWSGRAHPFGGYFCPEDIKSECRYQQGCSLSPDCGATLQKSTKSPVGVSPRHTTFTVTNSIFNNVLTKCSIRYPLRAACWSVGRIHNSVVSCNAGWAPAFSCRYKLSFPNICPHSTEFQPSLWDATAFTHVTSADSCKSIRISSCRAWQIYIFNACDGAGVIRTCKFCDF